MKFVIVGAGRVGLRTARVLDDEGHDVTVVEIDPVLVDRARDTGLAVVEGNGSREAVLTEAGIAEADALGALTGDLNANFAACTIANHHGVRTVMRIDEDYREDIYRRYTAEVDETIYPERLGAIGAKNALLGGSIRAVADIAQNLQIVELTVSEDSPTKGYTVSELQLQANATVVAFGKADAPLGLPDPDESLAAGDRLVVLADFDVLDSVRQIVVGDTRSAEVAGVEGGV
jgi:trk system potassium uptake protein TrkA